jgi:hypothetical protein
VAAALTADAFEPLVVPAVAFFAELAFEVVVLGAEFVAAAGAAAWAVPPVTPAVNRIAVTALAVSAVPTIHFFDMPESPLGRPLETPPWENRRKADSSPCGWLSSLDWL